MNDDDVFESEDDRRVWLWQTALAYAACAVNMVDTVGGTRGARDYINARGLKDEPAAVDALIRLMKWVEANPGLNAPRVQWDDDA